MSDPTNAPGPELPPDQPELTTPITPPQWGAAPQPPFTAQPPFTPQPPLAPQQPFAQQQPFTQQQPPTWQTPGVPGFAGGLPQVKKGVDISTVTLFQWLVMGGGVLAFIASFVPYYSYNIGLFGINIGTVSVNAWHGFFGWFGMLLVLAAAVIVALSVFTDFKSPMVPMITLIGAGAGFVCILLAMFVGFGGAGSYRNVGYWLSLLAAVAAGAGAAMIFMSAKKAEQPAPFAYPGTAPAYPPAPPQADPPAAPPFPPAPPQPFPPDPANPPTQ